MRVGSATLQPDQFFVLFGAFGALREPQDRAVIAIPPLPHRLAIARSFLDLEAPHLTASESLAVLRERRQERHIPILHVLSRFLTLI